MADKKEPEEKLFSVKEKRYYLRLGITIISLVVGAVILYYATSPLQNCKMDKKMNNIAYCYKHLSW